MSVKMTGFMLITIAIIGMGVWFMIGNSPFNIVEINSSRTLNAEGIRTIEVKSELSDVKIIPSSGDAIEVQVHGKTTRKWKDDYEIVASTDNGHVTIELKEKNDAEIFRYLQ